MFFYGVKNVFVSRGARAPRHPNYSRRPRPLARVCSVHRPRETRPAGALDGAAKLFAWQRPSSIRPASNGFRRTRSAGDDVPGGADKARGRAAGHARVRRPAWPVHRLGARSGRGSVRPSSGGRTARPVRLTTTATIASRTERRRAPPASLARVLRPTDRPTDRAARHVRDTPLGQTSVLVRATAAVVSDPRGGAAFASHDADSGDRPP